jgi:hypothetical protein
MLKLRVCRLKSIPTIIGNPRHQRKDIVWTRLNCSPTQMPACFAWPLLSTLLTLRDVKCPMRVRGPTSGDGRVTRSLLPHHLRYNLQQHIPRFDDRRNCDMARARAKNRNSDSKIWSRPDPPKISGRSSARLPNRSRQPGLPMSPQTAQSCNASSKSHNAIQSQYRKSHWEAIHTWLQGYSPN